MEEQLSTRFHMLDTLRGLMIAGVVLFHFVFDMYLLDARWAQSLIDTPIFEIIATVGRILFIFIAGICTRLTRNNLRRALLVSAAAIVVSLATLAVDLILFKRIGYLFIYCGILHLMAVCMLLYSLLDAFLHNVKLKSTISHILCLVLPFILIAAFIATYDVYNGQLLFGLARTPSVFHGSLMGILMGFGGYSLISADYFPLIPWVFMFFAGSFIGVYFKEDRVPAFLHKDICPPLTFVGRKTLWIYILHQPLVYGIALCISYITA